MMTNIFCFFKADNISKPKIPKTKTINYFIGSGINIDPAINAKDKK